MKAKFGTSFCMVERDRVDEGKIVRPTRFRKKGSMSNTDNDIQISNGMTTALGVRVLLVRLTA